jgi:AcrR family transcriptional regulator
MNAPSEDRRSGPQLGRRRQPVQARARQSITQILDAAAALLQESGIEEFNTNALAARAGVRVRTIYRYFPNKLAVMTALAERMAEEWNGWFDGFEELAEPSTDLRGLWPRYIGTFMREIRRIPGGLALRRAMRAIPELQAIDRRDNERLAAHLAAALAHRGDQRPRRQVQADARVLIETAVAVLDLALLERPARARALVDALISMQLAYLFDTGGRTGGQRRHT